MLALAGCRYSFNNPAENLGAGEVAGLCSSEAGPLPGAAVSLKGSVLDQASRPDGHFSVLPLPAGHHTLLLRQGQSRALLRRVDLGYGSDGQVEGVALGTLLLPRAASLSGALDTFGGGNGYGVVVDEVTGMATPTDPSFKLEGLPIGSHRLLVATRDGPGSYRVAGPVSVVIETAEQGTDKVVTGLVLRPASAVEGEIHFRVSSLESGLTSDQAVVVLTDAEGTVLPVPAPDSNGDRDVVLAEGLYFVEVRPPPAFTATVPTPPRAAAVVLQGDVFDLGTVYLASEATIEAAQLSCRQDADCAPGVCTEGVCTGYTPPEAAPAEAPFCADLSWCATPGSACDLPGAVAPAFCLTSGSSNVCVPCGSHCTPDGAAVLAGDACPP
ncbi:MAG TPA: hypothetical protein VFG59_16855 [Anaeromyxobacter sp.]|nr:hypothetical protein [Anaeromyxobacter sp.]